jgi:REP element-mobilizing transposase RayT
MSHGQEGGLPPHTVERNTPVARKWSNLNLPGALHYVTGNFVDRLQVFAEPACCTVFLDELRSLDQRWPSKLIAYVLMPDHFHLIINPRDGRIRELIGELKSLSARSIVKISKQFKFPSNADGHQVWQESFKDIPLWSGWMIWQKINYIHANPVKAGLVKSAKDYRWSSFRSFYSQGDKPLAVDHDWAWPDDAEKLSLAIKSLNAKVGGGKPPS